MTKTREREEFLPRPVPHAAPRDENGNLIKAGDKDKETNNEE